VPQFIMPMGHEKAERQFGELDAFTRGYIEAMFFTETGSGDDEELEHVTFADMAPETLDKITTDCAKFQADNRALLDRAFDMGFAQGHYDAESAGNDFWYTRNGHGVGYWDRDLGQVGDDLRDACKVWSGVTLYLGDDDKLYLM
jgi:hypothetical protein